MKFLFTGPVLTCIALILSCSAANAFPPAPSGLIYGLARDQYGAPLSDPTDVVLLQTPSGVQVTANIQPNLAVGVNYALVVPMDAGTVPPPYVTNALTAGTQYKLYVVIGGNTNLPIEMEGAYSVLGASSQQTLQNLTVGGDTNKDGIPDAWETAFLASIGVNVALTSIDPNSVYTQDGRTLLQEYVLGNFPYNSNAFSVTIVSQNAGSATLAFTTTAGRTYSTFGSTDLLNWDALSFIVPAVGGQPVTSYFSSAVQTLEIQTVQPTNSPTYQFFKVQLR